MNGIFSVLWTFSNNIPDYKFLKTINSSFKQMYSGNGDLVADFSKEKEFCSYRPFQRM